MNSETIREAPREFAPEDDRVTYPLPTLPGFKRGESNPELGWHRGL